jgi:hypothetical protein
VASNCYRERYRFIDSKVLVNRRIDAGYAPARYWPLIFFKSANKIETFYTGWDRCRTRLCSTFWSHPVCWATFGLQKVYTEVVKHLSTQLKYGYQSNCVVDIFFLIPKSQEVGIPIIVYFFLKCRSHSLDIVKFMVDNFVTHFSLMHSFLT